MTTPQPPHDKRWIFDETRLRPGDVVLERAEGKQSDLIAAATGGEYSHALILVDGGDFIEAVQGGSRTISVVRVLVDDPSRWRALRYIGHGQGQGSATIAGAAVVHARNLVFRPYNLKGAIASVTPLRPGTAAALFCSQLVAEAYRRAGASGFDHPDRITPASLETSKALTVVEPLPLVPAPFEELPIDRSAGYAGTDMQRENLVAQAAFNAVAGELAPLYPSRGQANWPPASLHDLVDLFVFCDPDLGAPLANRVHAVLLDGGYYHFFTPEMKAEMVARAPRAPEQVVRGWKVSYARAAHNAEQSAAVAAHRPWPFWNAHAELHARNAVFFATLISHSRFAR